jgi:hypothetical protein
VITNDYSYLIVDFHLCLAVFGIILTILSIIILFTMAGSGDFTTLTKASGRGAEQRPGAARGRLKHSFTIPPIV